MKLVYVWAVESQRFDGIFNFLSNSPSLDSLRETIHLCPTGILNWSLFSFGSSPILARKQIDKDIHLPLNILKEDLHD